MSSRAPIVAEDRAHLELLVLYHLKDAGPDKSMNHIDVSRVTDMDHLFAYSHFVGDISEWDTSAVTNMRGMFTGCTFNGDLSHWNTSRVACMESMFASSSFTGNIAHWNVGNVQSMNRMFSASVFNGDLSAWDVGNCSNFFEMFDGSRFNGNIAQWDVRQAATMQGMFNRSRFVQDISAWDVPLSCDTLRMFGAMPKTMAMQGPALWHAKLHLDNWSLPGEGPMLQAFETMRCIHDALGGNNEQKARDIVRMLVPKMESKGPQAGGDEGWALEGLV